MIWRLAREEILYSFFICEIKGLRKKTRELIRKKKGENKDEKKVNKKHKEKREG